MTNISLVFLGTAISVGCDLLFKVVAASPLAHVRNLVLVLYVVATVGLFFWASGRLKLKSLIGVGCVVAILSVGADHLLFPRNGPDLLEALFPWVAGDFDPVEWALGLLPILMAISWYLVIAIVANLAMSRLRLTRNASNAG